MTTVAIAKNERLELLTPEAWPLPTRFTLDRRLATEQNGSGSNNIATPWLDFASFNSPQYGARPVGAVLGREMEVACYYDQATTAPTYTSIFLIVESPQMGAGGQPTVTVAQPLATYDIRPQMSSLNGGVVLSLPIPPRIIRIRLAIVAPTIVGATRIVLAVTFDGLRFRMPD